MLLAGLILLGYNLWDSYRAQIESDKVLNELINLKEKRKNDKKQDSEQATKNIPSIKLNNYNYIGILRIPKINLELPVIDSFSYKKLKKAPCLYAGSVYDNNMIIAAHAYLSHFGKLNKLKTNDKIFFEDVTGNTFRYSVSETTILKENDVDVMHDGDWDLTLFTCTLSGDKRVTIRAIIE